MTGNLDFLIRGINSMRSKDFPDVLSGNIKGLSDLVAGHELFSEHFSYLRIIDFNRVLLS